MSVMTLLHDFIILNVWAPMKTKTIQLIAFFIRIVYGDLLQRGDTFEIKLRKVCIAVLFLCSFPIVGNALWYSAKFQSNGVSPSTVMYDICMYVLGFDFMIAWAVCHYTKHADDILLNITFVICEIDLMMILFTSPGWPYQLPFVTFAIFNVLINTNLKKLHLFLNLIGFLLVVFEDTFVRTGVVSSFYLPGTDLNVGILSGLWRHTIALVAGVAAIAFVIGVSMEQSRHVKRVETTLEIANEIAEKLEAYDTAGALDLLQERRERGVLDNRLLEAFSRIAVNMDRFRPYLPNYILDRMKGSANEIGPPDDPRDVPQQMNEDEESVGTPPESERKLPSSGGINSLPAPEDVESPQQSPPQSPQGASSPSRRCGINPLHAPSSGGINSLPAIEDVESPQQTPPQTSPRSPQRAINSLSAPLDVISVGTPPESPQQTPPKTPPQNRTPPKTPTTPKTPPASAPPVVVIVQPSRSVSFRSVNSVKNIHCAWGHLCFHGPCDDMSRFVTLVHDKAKVHQAGVHSFLGDKADLTWNVALRAPACERKALQFFMEVRHDTGDTKVCGAVASGRGRCQVAGWTLQAQLLHVEWSPLLQALSTLGASHDAVLTSRCLHDQAECFIESRCVDLLLVGTEMFEVFEVLRMRVENEKKEQEWLYRLQDQGILNGTFCNNPVSFAVQLCRGGHFREALRVLEECPAEFFSMMTQRLHNKVQRCVERNLALSDFVVDSGAWSSPFDGGVKL